MSVLDFDQNIGNKLSKVSMRRWFFCIFGADRDFRAMAGLKCGLAAAMAIAALLIWLIWWGFLQSAAYEREASYHVSEYAKYTGDKVANACVGIASVEKFRCMGDALNAQDQNQREEQDLVAQRQSALWALIMAVAAVGGMGLSVIGVLLVWTTFRETRKANEIARSAMIAENRAWIKLEFTPQNIEMCRDSLRMRNLSIRAKNTGNTVAKDVVCWGELHFAHSGNMVSEEVFHRIRPQFFKTQQAHNIWPDKEQVYTRDAHGLGISSGARLATDNFRIFLILIAEYLSIFDSPQDPKRQTELIVELTSVTGEQFDKVGVENLWVPKEFEIGAIHSNIGSGRIT